MTGQSTTDPFVVGLMELCRLNGIQVPPERLTDGLVNADGRLPPDHAAIALRRANMSCRIGARALDDISAASLPALLFLHDGQYAVLEWVGDGRCTLVHPETGGGREECALADLGARYAGRALFARPIDVLSDRLGETVGERRHWIIGPVLDNLGIYRDVVLAAFMANLLAIGSSLFSMQVYDRVVPSGAFDTLWILASGVAIAICLEFVLRIMRARLVDVTGRDLDLRLSSQLFEQVTNLHLSQQPKSTGVFANQVRDFAVVREFFTSSTVAALSDLPFTLIFISIIAFIGGPVALVTLCGSIAIVLPGIVMQKHLAKVSREHNQESAALNGILLEAVSNLETVKAARAENRLQRAYAQLSATIAGSSIRSRELTTLISQFVASTQQICYGGVVIVGVYRISEGHMTVGALIACTLLSGRALSPMSRVAGLLARWQGVRAAMEGLDRIMAMPVERPTDRQYLRAPHFAGAYRMQDITFSHEKDSPPELTINGLEIAAGEHAALIGANGAGKSTLLRMLAGFTNPTSGSLLIDNLSLSQIDPIDRRRQIGYLPQSVALFQGTLRDNLLLDRGMHSDDELMAALDAVGLGAYVRRHVRGLDLRIHSNANVSGGQRQAIGLARVLLQDPRIVLLDEPTAAFDQITEKHVIGYLREWLGSRTAIIATHKREVLALAETALVLKDGGVAYHGPLGQVIDLGAHANGIKTVK
ncbi:type I secretion system permease/ATPase [Sinirhodobacter huangdaonensis]|uniref:Type I secretion system permease/ATPase n=1 Tax=Paenirhodobacter huangdaonensis TaxID=2501515 RepID=A0A443LW01_9RHOB|nr:type I secretion system permease/ATPase [Sinirhodobacter huangdaonensis]RWR53360.1 type I secretion system permease/ATPase [Sinirhodobacter huangdaonensis]